jgi:hypothetical protein
VQHARKPTPPAKAHIEAQFMFQRVVTGWAMDALALRRAGLDRPSVRRGRSLGLIPGRTDAPRGLGTGVGTTPAIRWRPPSDLAA